MFAGHLTPGREPTVVPQASQAVGPVSLLPLLILIRGHESGDLTLGLCVL